MNINPNRARSRKEKQMNATTKATSAAVLVTRGLALAAWVAALAALTIANVALAADQHLTLRLEDGLPAGSHALPIIIVVPITAGKGEAGAAWPFYQYGPYTIDGSTLTVSGDRITGKLTGKSARQAPARLDHRCDDQGQPSDRHGQRTGRGQDAAGAEPCGRLRRCARRRGVGHRMRHTVDRWRQPCPGGGRRGQLPRRLHRAAASR